MATKTVTTSADAAKAPKEVKVKPPGVGAVAMKLLAEGKTNEEILAELKKQFPLGKTEMASVNWYRNKARSNGADVKTSRELNAGKPNPKKEAAAKAKADKLAEREKAKAAKAAEKEKAKAAKAAEKQKADEAKAKEKAAKEAAAAKEKAAKEKAEAIAKEKAAKEKAKADALAAKTAKKTPSALD